MTARTMLLATSRFLVLIHLAFAAHIAPSIAQAVSESGDPLQAELLNRLAELIQLEIDDIQNQQARFTATRERLLRESGVASRLQINNLDEDIAALGTRLFTLERELADATNLRNRAVTTVSLPVKATEDAPMVKAKAVEAEKLENVAVVRTEASLSSVDDARRIQDALIYAGGYDGRVDGKLGQRSEAAIKRLQKRLNEPATGVLTALQKAQLFEEATFHRLKYGIKTLDDSTVGYRLDYPDLLLSKAITRSDGGRLLASSDDASSLVIEIRDEEELSSVFAEQMDQYEISYSRLRDRWFVLDGQQKDGQLFYEVARRSEGRVIRARLTHPATEKILWDPFKVVLFNSFVLETRGS